MPACEFDECPQEGTVDVHLWATTPGVLLCEGHYAAFDAGHEPSLTEWVHTALRRRGRVHVLQVAAGRPNPGGVTASPHPHQLLIPVATVVDVARDLLGMTDDHDIQVAFDDLLIQAGGSRHDVPPSYGVPRELLGPAPG